LSRTAAWVALLTWKMKFDATARPTVRGAS